MNAHLTKTDLELYILEQLSSAEQTRVEEHLLICDLCRDAVLKEEIFFKSMRAAILREETRTREKDCLSIDRVKKRKI